MPEITAEELKQKLECDDDIVLIDALAPMIYAHSHLPRAINMPPSAVDTIRCARRLPDLGTEIVVYCANRECDDSVDTAQRLQALKQQRLQAYYADLRKSAKIDDRRKEIAARARRQSVT